MARSKIHVVPAGDKWQVRRGGAQRPSATANTQAGAVVEATRIAKGEKPSQVVIHRPNNRIREEHTYGKDPKKYPG